MTLMNVSVQPNRTAAEVGLATLFADRHARLPGGDAVRNLRRDAIGRFQATGLPHNRMEAWKYTDLKRLMEDSRPLPSPSPPVPVTTSMLSGLGFRRLAIVDGAFDPHQSDLDGLEDGLSVRSMFDALVADEPLLASIEAGAGDPVVDLNTAFASDGVDIACASGAIIERPIHLAFITTSPASAAMFMRSRLRLGDGARATIVETYEGPDASDYQVNAAFDMSIGEAATLDHVRIARDGSGALQLATHAVRIAGSATLRQFALDIGGAVLRNQLFVHVAGEGAAFELRKAALLTDHQHADTTLTIRHDAIGSRSHELFKTVADDQARAVFQGKIIVEPAAQQTDARMMSRALLLSDDAVVNCKPELEIFADDVQCGHGAAIGGLDDQMKFYLMARGIPAPEAEVLLIEAFVGEIFDRLEHDALAAAVIAMMSDWLQRRG